MYPILIIYSHPKNPEILFLHEFQQSLKKNYQVELIKPVEHIHHFFTIIKTHFSSQILKDNTSGIQIGFENRNQRNEFIKSVWIFYPNPYDFVGHDTQHLMKNEPIYSIYGNNILIGSLREDYSVQFGEKEMTFDEFSIFHWNLLPKELKKIHSPNKECRIKRKEGFQLVSNIRS
jgi:hypothetical protein